jgi:hypothetical protein
MNGFSLVAGGPLYRLFVRLRLLRPPIRSIGRLIGALVLLAWLPVAILILFGQEPGLVLREFLGDAETQVRLLIVLPVLIAAESWVHGTLASVPERFRDLGAGEPPARPGFEAALEKAARFRDATWEWGLVLFVLLLRASAWRMPTGWYVAPGTKGSLTLAGRWYAYFSVPLCQFLIFRWGLRYVNWALFLFRIARLPLRLLSPHPDRAGGLGFLEKASMAFAPILFSQSALLVAVLMHVAPTELGFGSYQLAAGTLFIAGAVIVLAPLTFFFFQLSAAKGRGSLEYGELTSRWIRAFDGRWLRGEEQPPDGDLGGLAPASSNYQAAKSMRLVPIGLTSVSGLAWATALPWLPFVLTPQRMSKLVNTLMKALW